MELVISMLVFLTVGVLGYLAMSLYGGKNGQVEMRLRALAGPAREQARQAAIEQELSQPFTKRVLVPVVRQGAELLSRLAPTSIRSRMAAKISEAGGFGKLSANEAIALSIALSISIPGMLYALGRLAGLPGERLVGICMIFFVVGLCLPSFQLRQKMITRKQSMQRDLPDVLDLLTVSVEAGLAFDGALAKVSEKMSGALVEEFSRLLHEIRIGVPRRDSLRALGERCGVADLSLLMSALIQADQLGVSISSVLRVQSEQIRHKRRQRAEEQAMKAPIKMLIPMVLFIFPTIFVILLGPAAIQMIKVFGKM